MSEVFKKGAATAAFGRNDAVDAALPRRILVHICCGPCSIMPLKTMLSGKAEVWGFFHNPNIHPKKEFLNRLGAVKRLASLLSLDVIYDEDYAPRDFIEGLKAAGGGGNHPAHGQRCAFCYSERLERTARAAVENGFDAFSSSLLYSRYQDHDGIRRLGVDFAARYGILFYYEDFRAGWQAGIDASKEMGLYRQKHCGCVYSRVERYSKKKNKKAGAG